MRRQQNTREEGRGRYINSGKKRKYFVGNERGGWWPKRGYLSLVERGQGTRSWLEPRWEAQTEEIPENRYTRLELKEHHTQTYICQHAPSTWLLVHLRKLIMKKARNKSSPGASRIPSLVYEKYPKAMKCLQVFIKNAVSDEWKQAEGFITKREGLPILMLRERSSLPPRPKDLSDTWWQTSMPMPWCRKEDIPWCIEHYHHDLGGNPTS